MLTLPICQPEHHSIIRHMRLQGEIIKGYVEEKRFYRDTCTEYGNDIMDLWSIWMHQSNHLPF
jgi:hypothetical protein